MTHAFHAIGNTCHGETVLGVYPVVDDAQEAFEKAERQCAAHRRQKATAFKPYAYVKEVGYDDDDETPTEQQERAAAEREKRVLTALRETNAILARAKRYRPEFQDNALIARMEVHKGKLVAMLGKACAAEYRRRFGH